MIRNKRNKGKEIEANKSKRCLASTKRMADLNHNQMNGDDATFVDLKENVKKSFFSFAFYIIIIITAFWTEVLKQMVSKKANYINFCFILFGIVFVSCSVLFCYFFFVFSTFVSEYQVRLVLMCVSWYTYMYVCTLTKQQISVHCTNIKCM